MARPKPKKHPFDKNAELFAVVKGGPDGTEHVSLWSTRELAEKKETALKAQISKAMGDLEWVKVVPTTIDNGIDITYVWGEEVE